MINKLWSHHKYYIFLCMCTMLSTLSCSKSVHIQQYDYSQLNSTDEINYRIELVDGRVYETDMFTTQDSILEVESTIADGKRVIADPIIIIPYKDIKLLERIEHTTIFYVSMTSFAIIATASGLIIYAFSTIDFE